MKKPSLIEKLKKDKNLENIHLEDFDLNVGDFRNANALMYLLREPKLYDKNLYKPLVDKLIPLTDLTQLGPLGNNCLSIAIKAEAGELSDFAWKNLVTQNINEAQNKKFQEFFYQNSLSTLLSTINMHIAFSDGKRNEALNKILHFTEDKDWLIRSIEEISNTGVLKHVALHPDYVTFREKRLLEKSIKNQLIESRLNKI